MSEAVRGILFFVSAAFILFAPGARVFSNHAPPYAVRWEMFSGIARDLYEVSFETTDASGARVPVDRFEVLGYPDPVLAPRPVRTVKQEAEAWSLVRQLCVAMGPDKPLYMKLRDATRAGWKVVEDGKVDVCLSSHGGFQRTRPTRSSEPEEVPQ